MKAETSQEWVSFGWSVKMETIEEAYEFFIAKY